MRAAGRPLPPLPPRPDGKPARHTAAEERQRQARSACRDAGLCPTPRPPSEGPRTVRQCSNAGGCEGSRGGFLLDRAPGAYQEPPGAAKAKRKRHGVSLGGPRRTLVRRSCPIEEGPTPLSPTPAETQDQGPPAARHRESRTVEPTAACELL